MPETPETPASPPAPLPAYATDPARAYDIIQRQRDEIHRLQELLRQIIAMWNVPEFHGESFDELLLRAAAALPEEVH